MFSESPSSFYFFFLEGLNHIKLPDGEGGGGSTNISPLSLGPELRIYANRGGDSQEGR